MHGTVRRHGSHRVRFEDRVMAWAFVALIVTLLMLCATAFLEGWYGL